MNEIDAWADKWKMALNSSKTEGMVISSNNADLKWEPTITLKGRQIKIVKEYRFLGITIDGGLRFTTHVNRVIDKGKKRNRVLRCLAGKDWGQRMSTQRGLYITYVRSALEYACASWYPWISKTARRRIEAVQNESLRIMTRMSKTTPKDFLRCQAGIEPLEERMKKNSKILFEKYSRLEESDPRRQLKERDTVPKLTTRHGWRHTTKKEMASFAGINRNTPKTTFSPWTRINTEITQVEMSEKKEEVPKEELKRRTEAKITEIDADVEIYTDGSTAGDQMNGGAGVHIRDKTGRVLHEESVPAGRMCSSYDGECVAMEAATRWINIQPLPPRHYAIYTDSKSLVETLKEGRWKNNHEWLKATKKNLAKDKHRTTICWVPSHCGTLGNEKADELAESGAKMNQGEAPVTFSIVKAKIRNEKWKIEHHRAADTFKKRRKPKDDVESNWPDNIQQEYGRLRSNHDKKLRSYRHFIGLDENQECEICGEEPETITHILCKCPALEMKRREHRHDGKFTEEDLVEDPETCRKILSARFHSLRLENEIRQNDIRQSDSIMQPFGPQGDTGLTSLA